MGRRDSTSEGAPVQHGPGDATVDGTAVTEPGAHRMGGDAGEDATAALAGPPGHLDATVADGPAARRGRVRLEAGAKLGRYTILERVGAGGMGVVYAAYDPVLDRKIAIKLVERSRASGEWRERLLREAKAIARLSHPNTITIFDAGTVGDEVFLAMEFVEGQTLRRWMQRRDPGRTWRDVVRVLIAAGRGLEAAHRAGIVHRDFKPDNVLIDPAGTPKVLDFGIARSDSDTSDEPDRAAVQVTGELSISERELTRTGVMLGTPAYMSPEQLDGEPCTARGDQFAFSVVLYEALYGTRPFRGKSLEQLRSTVRSGEIRVPERSVVGVPRWLRDVLLRGLAREPDDRWPDMTAMLAALTRDPARRRARGAIVAGVGVALALSAASLWYARSGRSGVGTCDGADAQLARVWNDAARAAITRSFAASGVPFAPDSSARAVAALDAWGQRWTAGHVDACVAHARGEQSGELLDLRMACLVRRRAELEATVDVLAEADADVVRNAAEVVAGLPNPADCADAERLRARADVDPAAASEDTLGLHAELARIEALDRAGRFDDGLQLARSVERQARAVDAARVAGLALQKSGRLLMDMARSDEAEAALSDAYFELLATRDDEQAAETAVMLTALMDSVRGRDADFERWARHAEALVARVGTEVRAAGGLEYTRGVRALRRGDFAAGQRHIERARELFGELLEDDVPLRAMIEGSLGIAAYMQNDLDRARGHLHVALELRERSFGPEHPETASALNNLAVHYSEVGELERARGYYERALAIYERTLGPAHPDVSWPLGNLGELAGLAGQHLQAEAYLRRAVAVMVAARGEDNLDLASWRVSHASALGTLHRYDDAHAQIAAAMRAYQASAPDHPELLGARQVRANLWLLQGRPADAIRELRAILARLAEVDPDDDARAATLWSDLGHALARSGRVQAAREAYGTALERAPGAGDAAAQVEGEVRARLGELLLEREPDAALEHLDAARRLLGDAGPRGGHVLLQVLAHAAIIEIERGNLARAELLLGESAASASTAEPAVRAALAVAEHRLARARGDVDGARAAARRAIAHYRAAHPIFAADAAPLRAWLDAPR